MNIAIGIFGLALWAFVWFMCCRDRRTPAERGAANGRAFVAGKPSRAEVLASWSSACIDETFANDNGAYARAWKDEVRPLWQKYKP